MGMWRDAFLAEIGMPLFVLPSLHIEVLVFLFLYCKIPLTHSTCEVAGRQ